MFSRIHCNFVFITFLMVFLHNFIFQDVSSLFLTFFTCYSTRCLLTFFLVTTRFSHSLQLRVHLDGLPHSKHVTAQDLCWIYSRINVSCILCMLAHTFFKKKFCLLGFCKINFTIHLIFKGIVCIIFRPLFSTWYCTWCYMNFST